MTGQPKTPQGTRPKAEGQKPLEDSEPSPNSPETVLGTEAPRPNQETLETAKPLEAKGTAGPIKPYEIKLTAGAWQAIVDAGIAEAGKLAGPRGTAEAGKAVGTKAGGRKGPRAPSTSNEWMNLWAKERPFSEELFSEKGREDYSTITEEILKDNLRLRTVDVNSLSEIVKLENLCHVDRWSVDNFVSELQRSFTLSKGLWLGKSLVGLCLSWIIPPECHLLNLMVHPSLWGRGLGRYLMEDLIETAKTEKAYKILLEVKVGNKRARKLYSNLGFIDAGFRRQYYSDGSNANLMTLELPAPPGVSLAVTKRHPPKPPVPLGRNNKP